MTLDAALNLSWFVGAIGWAVALGLSRRWPAHSRSVHAQAACAFVLTVILLFPSVSLTDDLFYARALLETQEGDAVGVASWNQDSKERAPNLFRALKALEHAEMAVPVGLPAWVCLLAVTTSPEVGLKDRVTPAAGARSPPGLFA